MTVTSLCQAYYIIMERGETLTFVCNTGLTVMLAKVGGNDALKGVSTTNGTYWHGQLHVYWSIRSLTNNQVLYMHKLHIQSET